MLLCITRVAHHSKPPRQSETPRGGPYKVYAEEFVNAADNVKLFWHCVTVLLNKSKSETERQVAPVAFELQIIEPSFTRFAI
jgi:hypothetical protein